jgi:hypothetical protein
MVTITFATTNQTKKGNDHEMAQFAEALKSGQVGGVMFYDCNPVYDNGCKLGKVIGGLKLSLSLTIVWMKPRQNVKLPRLRTIG